MELSYSKIWWVGGGGLGGCETLLFQDLGGEGGGVKIFYFKICPVVGSVCQTILFQDLVCVGCVMLSFSKVWCGIDWGSETILFGDSM